VEFRQLGVRMDPFGATAWLASPRLAGRSDNQTDSRRKGPFLYLAGRDRLLSLTSRRLPLMNICTKPNLTPMKSRYPKTLEERQRILEVFRGMKTARSAQAYAAAILSIIIAGSKS
jgi:hypothetical protein